MGPDTHCLQEDGQTHKRTPAQYELTQANSWLPMSPPGQTLEPDVLAAARPQKVNSSSCGKKIKYASIFKENPQSKHPLPQETEK